MSDTIIAAIITVVFSLIGWLVTRNINTTLSGLNTVIQQSNEDRKSNHADLKSSIVDVKLEVKELGNKVGIQNGRVGKLEVRTDNIEGDISELKENGSPFNKPPRKKRNFNK